MATITTDAEGTHFVAPRPMLPNSIPSYFFEVVDNGAGEITGSLASVGASFITRPRHSLSDILGPMDEGEDPFAEVKILRLDIYGLGKDGAFSKLQEVQIPISNPSEAAKKYLEQKVQDQKELEKWELEDERNR